MARPLRIEFPGAFYHVTSRGNERKAIFRSQRDREKFISYLESAIVRYGAIIHVYCLMDNHYHLLVETPSGNLSQIMQHINGAYTTYFNVKRQRSGHLFQGRYKAILIDVDEYAKELSRYIHLNPVRAGAVGTPGKYRWSSYVYYADRRNCPEWLVTDFILGYFSEKASVARKRYRDFVESLVGQEYESPLDHVAHSTFLGGVDFINEIKDTYLKRKKPDRNLPVLRELSSRPGLDQIEDAVELVIGSDTALLRQIKLYFCHRYSGKKLNEIGARFGISDSGVSQSSHRISDRLELDRALRSKVRRIKKRLYLSNV